MPVASAMTFSSLIADLQSYLERGQITDPLVYAQLPKLINNAERRISRGVKILGFQRPLTNSFIAGSPLLSKPDRWRETISFNFGTFNFNTGQYTKRNPLLERNYEFVRQHWPDDSVVGTPRYFADYDYNTWLIAPTPDQSYPFEVMFWEMPALLDSVNTQNWISIYAPEVLLYSALLECAPFLKNDERIGTWENLFSEGMKALSNEDVQDLVGRATETRQSVTSGGPP
jgi:hypothetical protein